MYMLPGTYDSMSVVFVNVEDITRSLVQFLLKIFQPPEPNIPMGENNE
jgi:hypothetical protein